MFEQIRVAREKSGAGTCQLVLGDGSQPQQMLAEHASQAQVVYLDPPFMTGEQFVRRRRFGPQGWKTGSPSIDLPAYSDSFASREAYLRMLRGLIENAWMLLAPTGMLCLHLDWRSSHYARMLLDEVFGEDRFVNEIVWAYESGGRARRYYSRKHDIILMYARSRNYRFRVENVPLLRGETRRNHLRKCVDEQGRAYRSIIAGGKEYRYYDDEPVYPGDVWTDISHLQQRDPERTGYPTQKPLRLLDRLLRPLVEPGDLVCDLCCGSGTTLAAAQALGCRCLGMDVSSEALLVAQCRLAPGDLVLEAPSSDEPAALEGTYDRQSGLVMLSGCDIRNPIFPATYTGLDALERWSCGRLCGDELRVEQVFQRTPKHSELPPMCLMPASGGNVAISTVDASGIRRVYRWVDSSAQQEGSEHA